MNIHGADATGDTTEFAEISAKKSPHRALQRGLDGGGGGGGAAALQFPLSDSDIPPAHAHPNVGTLAYTHAHTVIHLHAFMFTRSGC